MRVALMWEARAAEGRGGELLDWVRAQRLPARPVRLELLTAPGDRVLAITWWDAAQAGETADTAALPEIPELPELPEPPAGLVSRPVHRWRFTSVHTA